MLFHELDAFIVQIGAVLDRRDARAHGILDSIGAVRMGGDLEPEGVRLFNGGRQLVRCELLRLGAAAVREDGARGEHLDHVHALRNEQTHFLPYFPRTVGLAKAHVPRQLHIGRDAGHAACATGDRDVGAGNIHAWTEDVAAGNCVAQGDVVERAVGAEIANGREAGHQRRLGIRDRCHRNLG